MEETTILNNLNPIKEYLNQPLIQYHPLTNLLKSEIDNIENQIRTPSQVNTTMNLQTSAFLALGRGTSSPRRLPRRRADSNDENTMLDAMNAMNISTPFSNRIQRELTQQMTSMAADPTND
jgi:hypothetical protein